ncbi:Glutamine-rich protein 2 [Harpegnathos saltator]|uniref:Glutamine-rich protein 2 n=1 Tax=Harpegnathos saltator TaxID=610380 RepID=E2BZ99_HARSA|nr:Glutamine-rich protein 2 [Harpegnathos saltator]
MVASLKPGPSLRLQEYNVTDSAGKISQRIPETDGTSVEVLAKAENDLKVTKGVKQRISPGKDIETEMVIFVEPIVDGSTPTALAFKQLEQSVKELQNQFQALKELSTSPEMMERLKSRMTDPVTDMWQFININKRLEASEQGINKLTRMLQDVMRGNVGATAIADTPEFDGRLDGLESEVAKMDQEFSELRAIADNSIKNNLAIADDRTDVTPEVVVAEPEVVPEIAVTDEATVPFRENGETTEEVSEAAADVPRRTDAETADIADIRRDIAALKTDTAKIQRELRDLAEKVAQRADIIERPKIDEISDDIKRHLEAMEATQSKVLSDITERLDKLEKEVGGLLTKVDSAQAAARADDINELVAKIQEIQTDMERLGQIADKLIDDKECRETHLNTLLEQIEILKTIKADKEDLEDALADKADAQAVSKKVRNFFLILTSSILFIPRIQKINRRQVSHDRFDAACDDLARGLMETVDKLNKQELIWQQALDKVQNEIASKVDKIEMTPLKDLVNTRLKSLQEKLKCMAEMKRENEAAGTKKMLKDVQCISCDKDAVMKTEEVCGFRLEPLPSTSSMRPYLTYELDQVRKQQRKLPHSRNMIQFEAAMQEIKRLKTLKEETPAKTPRDHLCNRYCGGSHTVTTPQQRVLRTGHFLTQGGPEAIQLSDGMIRGKDGQMYRGRPMTCKQDICDSRCWESPISSQVPVETYSCCSKRFIVTFALTATAPLRYFRFLKNMCHPFQRRLLVNPFQLDDVIAPHLVRKRESRKLSKEPEITEQPPIQAIEEATKVQRVIPKESNDYPMIVPPGPQDEIIYETNMTANEH